MGKAHDVQMSGPREQQHPETGPLSALFYTLRLLVWYILPDAIRWRPCMLPASGTVVVRARGGARRQVYGLQPERIWVSVFEADDETFALWRDVVGVPEGRIRRLGAADNFWEAGPTGAAPSPSPSRSARLAQSAGAVVPLPAPIEGPSLLAAR